MGTDVSTAYCRSSSGDNVDLLGNLLVTISTTVVVSINNYLTKKRQTKPLLHIITMDIFHDSRALARTQRSTMGKKIWFRNLVPRVLSVASKQPNFNRERARARDKKQRRPIFLEKKT